MTNFFISNDKRGNSDDKHKNSNDEYGNLNDKRRNSYDEHGNFFPIEKREPQIFL
jgi:hypothetical protein